MSAICCDKTKYLAQDIFDNPTDQPRPYTLVLGAGASISSNCPNWETLCRDYCNRHKIKVEDGKYSATFKNAIKGQARNRSASYSAFARITENVVPSIGYYHLATLISNGVFKTIITTNFDDLLERALSLIIPTNRVKVLIRGEVSDDYIADFIEQGIPQIKIIKFHGDIQSNIFFIQDDEVAGMSARLREVLTKELKTRSIIVGSSLTDRDLSSLYACAEGYHLFVNPESPSEYVRKTLQLGTENDSVQIIDGKEGCFDKFFTELNLEYQRHVIKKKKVQREKIEKNIMAKQEKGAGYINYSRLGGMIVDFWNKIKSNYSDGLPDIIVFINDPSAPGGMEMKRRMIDLIREDKRDTIIETVKIEGVNTRSNEREVKSEKPAFEDPQNHKKVLIVDAISFSGNTMKIAIERYRKWFPTYSIRGAIMVIDEQLLKNIEKNRLLRDLIHSIPTDRHEIFFPWGVTQATETCCRELKGLDTFYPVTISKRPWGTVEILAQQQNCSVRILTIEADQKLSFQRHLVRDEFFISLDDNIGLEICAQTLDSYNQRNEDPGNDDINDIKEIKSLVLEKGEYILIPKGIWHRAKASKERVRLLEIGYGAYDQNNDIERIADIFGRPKKDGSV